MEHENKSLHKLITFITLALIFILFTRTPVDADLRWHLRAGQVMVEQQQILLTDIFSFTRNGAGWDNAFWVSEILLYSLYVIGHYFAIAFFVSLTGVVTFYIIARRQLENPFINGFVLI